MSKCAAVREGRAWSAFVLILASACRFDEPYRDIPGPASAPVCVQGDVRCSGDRLETCAGLGTTAAFHLVSDCHAVGQVCAPALGACAMCLPGEIDCRGQSVVTCDAAGQSWVPTEVCDPTTGHACRSGRCVQLCDESAQRLSNIGCEYWGADLDNAVISPSLNAAAQQYAIVVSNVQPDVPARVIVQQDDSLAGEATHQMRVVANAVIAPQNLVVFKLGPREVDGSADGTFNTGTGTALTRHAFKVTSTFPIVAYQFNPLDNVNVFSNDASQLLPVSGLNTGVGRAYVVPAWPQTLAISAVPSGNAGIDLRAFLAIIATRPDTHVHVKTTARVIAGGPFPTGIDLGASADATLQPFEVLNLETGDFNADFTGTLIDADQPIAVFPGSEASDAPSFQSLSTRYCCADHLEHQTAPIRAVGKSYVLAKMPNRTTAVIAAGGNIGAVDETEYYRIVAVAAGATHIKTSLPAPWAAFDLHGEGDSQIIPSKHDFLLDASQPAMVLEVQSSQEAGGVPRGLPGGDPSTSLVPPREQWRSDYVLLTPDKYVFDYLVVVAPSDAHVYIDGLALDASNSEVTASDGLTPTERGSTIPPYWTYRFQLSYPIIDSTRQPPDNIRPGKQNDGVHHVQADQPVSVMAYGFDSFVSYAYAGGTQLTVINAL
ncbi:MAG: IgGFc-binding protein [Myxococcota bacterium]|nr:IgGFc-binding protein [Myxococcota bacterium]